MSSMTSDFFRLPPTTSQSEGQTKTQTTKTTSQEPERFPKDSGKKDESTRKEEEEEGHEAWGNPVQFILTAIGLAVGLGNIWRFPFLAYQHGGAAFLIAYIICGFTFGLPAIYAEFLIGQFSRINPARAFYRYAPAFHGLGLFTALLCFLIGIFYALVIAWSELYLAFTVSGNSWKWSECNNDWNTPNCVPTKWHMDCRSVNSSLPYAAPNGTCLADPVKDTNNGATEFFLNYVLIYSKSILDFGEFNWRIAACVAIFYILCALTLWKGIRILEKTSYVTVPLPYIVVFIFLGRVFFLEGSYEGIKAYLFNPDFKQLLDRKTWTDALTQVCFSLALGCGATIALASHNKKSNNCFRDALIVVLFDTLMSVVGGVAVFGTLGYLSYMTGTSLDKVATAGPPLIFITYVEATATMPLSWLWNLLFFLMIFLLGFSSMVAIVAFLTDFVLESLPQMKQNKRWKIITPCILCLILALFGTILSTGSGSYWFEMMADFIATTAPCIAVFLQTILLAWVYRWKNIVKDMEDMWGPAPKSSISRFFSRYSPYFKYNWMFVTPLMAISISVLTLMRDIPAKSGGQPLPIWAETIGWSMNLCPCLAFIIYFIVNWMQMKSRGIAFKYMFMPAKGLPSHDRYYKKKGIDPLDGWRKQERADSSSNSTILSKSDA